MIQEVLFLASSSISNPGASINTFLESAGFYSYILPFLLIFALVYGILIRLDLFSNNKPVTAIIAVSVGLLALQFGTVSDFFSKIFPQVGVGLSILLGILILLGAFIDKDKQWILYVLLAIATIIAAFVIYPSFREAFGIASTGSSYDTGVIFGWVLIAVVVIVAMLAAFGWNPFKPSQNPQTYQPALTHPQTGQTAAASGH